MQNWNPDVFGKSEFRGFRKVMWCKYFRVSDISKGSEQYPIIKHTMG